MQTCKIFGCSERSLIRWVDKYKSTNKDILDEIPIHIYKNLIKESYDRSEKYVKRPSTRKPKKNLDSVGVLNVQICEIYYLITHIEKHIN